MSQQPAEQAHAEIPPSVQRKRAAWLLGAFAVLCAVSWTHMAGLLPRTGDAPADAYARALPAAQTIEPPLGPADVILVHPPWRLDAQAAVKDALRATHPRMLVTTAAPKHAGQAGRLVVLSDASGPGLARGQARLAHAKPPVQTGGIDVAWLRAAQDGAFSLRPLIATAHARVENHGGHTSPCTYAPGKNRLVCRGEAGWMYQGPHTTTAAGKNWPCVWAHPKKNATVHLRFENVSIPAGAKLHGAITDSSVSGQGATVTVKAALGGTPVATLSVRDKKGVQSVAMPESARQTLDIAITAPDDGRRHFCFDITAEAP